MEDEGGQSFESERVKANRLGVKVIIWIAIEFTYWSGVVE